MLCTYWSHVNRGIKQKLQAVPTASAKSHATGERQEQLAATMLTAHPKADRHWRQQLARTANSLALQKAEHRGSAVLNGGSVRSPLARVDPYQPIDALRSCRTTVPGPSRSASTKLPFVAYGGRPGADVGGRRLAGRPVAASNRWISATAPRWPLLALGPAASSRRRVPAATSPADLTTF